MADISGWLKIRTIEHVAEADDDGLYLTPSGEVWRRHENKFTLLDWGQLQDVLNARIPRQRSGT